MRLIGLMAIACVLLLVGCVNSNSSPASGNVGTVNPTNGNSGTSTPTPAPTTSPSTTAPDPANNPTTTTSPPAANPIYKLSDIAPHNNESSCWTAIAGKVYDITEFIPSHPGGPAIMQACGVDGTALFDGSAGTRPHSQRAFAILQQYYIGDLAAGS